MARYGFPADERMGRGGRRHPPAGQAARSRSRARAGPVAHRHLRSPHARGVRGRPAHVTPAQMDAGAATSTTGPSATRSAFTCSIERRTPGRKWPVERQRASSSSARPSRCWPALPARQEAPDAALPGVPPLIERGARDERNFVKKGVSWALRGIGHRNPALHAASSPIARRLAKSKDAAPRWVGKDATKRSDARGGKSQARARQKIRCQGCQGVPSVPKGWCQGCQGCQRDGARMPGVPGVPGVPGCRVPVRVAENAMAFRATH